MTRRSWVALTAVGVAALLSTGPARAAGEAETSAGIEAYRELKLENGLRVALAADHRVPEVVLRIEYAVGDVLDPPNQRGLGQLIGELLPRLDTRHLHAAERPRLLRAAGLRPDEPKVQVSDDETSLTLQLAPEQLELSLWIEADRMGFASDGVTDTLLHGEIPRAAEAASNLPDAPDAFIAFRAAYGVGHPYGALLDTANIAGAHTTEVVARLHRYYNPASASLVLVGDLDLDEAERFVRQSFGPLPGAALTPLRSLPSNAPPVLSVEAPVARAFSALVWPTPAFLAPDDATLDLIARILRERLAPRKLCSKLAIGQRSRALGSVFVASCSGPSTSFDVWQSALEAELTALSDAKVSSSELEAAAWFYSRTSAQRVDDPLGRAAAIGALLRHQQSARDLPQMLQRYQGIDAQQLAQVVRRDLSPSSRRSLQVTPGPAGTQAAYDWTGGSARRFAPPAEASPLSWGDGSAFQRPPAKGKAPRFQPQSAATATLASGDRLRSVERHGSPIAYAQVLLPWPSGAFNPAARPVVAYLVKEAATSNGTLQEALKSLGAELYVDDGTPQLAFRLEAPTGTLSAALQLLGDALSAKQLTKAKLDPAKDAASAWLDPQPRGFAWYWDLVGLSAPTSRYRYLPRSSRTRLLKELKYVEVDRLWQSLAHSPRAISLIGPFDGANAQALATVLARRGHGSDRAAFEPPAKALFKPGTYLLDGSDGQQVRGNVLWPLPSWPTVRYAPAYPMPFLFRTDGEFGDRLAEHSAKVERWQANTVLTPDGDFLRYTFQVPIEQLVPLLESLQAHMARLAEGKLSALALASALTDEREFQLRKTQSGASLLDNLERAGEHDAGAGEALAVPLDVDGVTPQQVAELAGSLTLARATIGLSGPATRLTEALRPLGLVPASVTKGEPPSAAVSTTPAGNP